MDSAQLLVTVLGAGGGGAALLALINGFYKWLNGSAGRERDKNTSLVAQRKNAVEDRDKMEVEREVADQKRRDAIEYASILRRQLIEAGLEPIPMPVEVPATPGVAEATAGSPKPLAQSRYEGKNPDE